MTLKNKAIAVAVLLAAGLAACTDPEGPAENLGERVDDAVAEGRDRLQDARDEAEDAIDDLRDTIDDN
jgi:hypothetical protein